ncbi:hypothetical protein [Cellulomonas septica]|uniref:UbiC transcription regulator-associated domain-containing protein n=1 Tax=Cellulomonas septica TaxID=285080 RepID=A0ABX1JYR9_9CELL|nr:hypothetical protein [Cellulomonas septica]NKY39064.1 hypothetical protein [Cellulomonas septica]
MTRDEVYGSRPDLLPPGLVRLTWTRATGAEWVACEGVELLTVEEHLRVERDTVGRFSRRSDGSVDWSAHPGCVVRSTTATPDAFARELRTLAGEGGSLVASWGGSSTLPSVRVAADRAIEVLPEAVVRSHEVTVWRDDVRGLLEYAYFHDSVVRARVPSDG